MVGHDVRFETFGFSSARGWICTFRRGQRLKKSIGTSDPASDRVLSISILEIVDESMRFRKSIFRCVFGVVRRIFRTCRTYRIRSVGNRLDKCIYVSYLDDNYLSFVLSRRILFELSDIDPRREKLVSR